MHLVFAASMFNYFIRHIKFISIFLMPVSWQTRKQTTTEDIFMLQTIRSFFRAVPTPLAGLALGIASLGMGLEKSLPLHNFGQVLGALTSMTLTLLLAGKFAFNPRLLL